MPLVQTPQGGGGPDDDRDRQEVRETESVPLKIEIP